VFPLNGVGMATEWQLSLAIALHLEERKFIVKRG
jgi:hypothetical protein